METEDSGTAEIKKKQNVTFGESEDVQYGVSGYNAHSCVSSFCVIGHILHTK